MSAHFTHQTAWPVVSYETFAVAMLNARQVSEQVRNATSEPTDVENTIYVLSPDSQSGYAVRPDGELVLVFSLVKGRGDFIVRGAIVDGAVYLDCFDGYLPTLYGRHGFMVCKRVANWTDGEPDVLYMALPGYFDRHGITSF